MKRFFIFSRTIFFVLFLSLPLNVFSQQLEITENDQLYLQLINNVFIFVENNYVDQVDSKVLYEGALKGMLEALEDPYSTYLDSDMMTSMSDTTEGTFGGVGLTISKRYVSTPDEPAYVEVVSPIEDTPGWKAGILPGDKLTKINGKSTPDITMEEVLEMLRGEIGKPVEVTVLRGNSLEFTTTLIRDLIEVPTVKYGMMENQIGYLRIINFTPLTADKTQEALDNLFKQNAKGLIIDLRNNPGGVISSVVNVADKFIDSGIIVSTKSRISYENQSFSATRRKTTVPKDIPVVVLINQGSASASEILAGALKDHKRALLVGEKTYGKGSVQQVLKLSETDGLKLTIAKYYTPSDANIDKTGIYPDVEVKFPEFTEEEEKILTELLSSSEIKNLVESKKPVTDEKVEEIVTELEKKYPVNRRYLKKLVNNERYITETAPLYDLDYDIQLKEALRIITTEPVQKLIDQSVSVKEHQEKYEAINP